MQSNLFGGLDAAQFLRRHWQKRPLVVRDALTEYATRISRADLIELATREEIESRIVMRARGRWNVRHGPFSARDIERLPRTGWTLLVQGVDHVRDEASRLLREFSFIPYARLDDVMVSYAAPGGGVGPHFDTYDVFLMQGSGKRRWRVSRPRDLELEPDAPLKILRRFEPEHEWTLEPGDLLYVPPRWAHDGVAVGECITCSVGFRAPGAQELAGRFLDFLQDELQLGGLYSDPDLKPTATPARIDAAMLTRLRAMLARVRWSQAQVDRFIGCYVSEPKANVVFDRPSRPIALHAFERAVRKRGLKLAPATRMLYHGRWIFLNGEAFAAGGRASILHKLADARALPPLALEEGARPFLYDAYLAGYIEVGHER